MNARIKGILSAPAKKRYKNFLRTAADSEEVWMLKGDEGECTYDIDDEIFVIVYPTEEFAKMFCRNGEVPVMMEVHKFCKKCKKLIEEQNIGFAVFPNDVDVINVLAETLYYDLVSALEEFGDYEEDYEED